VKHAASSSLGQGNLRVAPTWHTRGACRAYAAAIQLDALFAKVPALKICECCDFHTNWPDAIFMRVFRLFGLEKLMDVA
jgi:hypothetical protein